MIPASGPRTLVDTQAGVEIIKAEVHKCIAALRSSSLDDSKENIARFRYELPAEAESSLLRALRVLYRALQANNDLLELDVVTYTAPFIAIIQNEKASTAVTGLALASLQKFAAFGFLFPEAPRAGEAINRIVRGVCNCKFEPVLPAEDELVLLRLLDTLTSALHCPAGPLLTNSAIWEMTNCIYTISQIEGISSLLRSSAEASLGTIVTHVFSRCSEFRAALLKHDSFSSHGRDTSTSGRLAHTPSQFDVTSQALSTATHTTPATSGATTPDTPQRLSLPLSPPSRTPALAAATVGHVKGLETYDHRALVQLLSWLAALTDPAAHPEPVALMGLDLVNLALETSSGDLADLPGAIPIIQSELCRHLIALSRSKSLPVLSQVLRVIYNLCCSRTLRVHLKVQLEVFLVSIHCALAEKGQGKSPQRREFALESLLDFYRTPNLPLEIFLNFDSDPFCVNLFEQVCLCLARNATPDTETAPATGASSSGAKHADHTAATPGTPVFSSIHALALEALLAVLFDMGYKCPGHPAYGALPHGAVFGGVVFGVGDALAAGMASPSVLTVPTVLPTGVHADVAYDDRSATPLHGYPSGHTPTASSSALASTLVPTEDTLQRVQTNRALKKKQSLAATRFNTDNSERWVAYVQELGLLPSPADAKAVAEFFRTCPGLDKTKVGEYISEPDLPKYAFNTQVREALVQSFDFKGMRIDHALRAFLGAFKLPGESQKIERLMDAFSIQFFQQSPEPMHSQDTAFILAYSVIMLHTDAHNPNIRADRRMSKEQFRQNNKGIDNGNDLPDSYLDAIYDDITTREITMLSSGASIPGVGLPGLSSTGSGSGSGPPSTKSGTGGGAGAGETALARTAGVSGAVWDGVLKRQQSVTAYILPNHLALGMGGGIGGGIGVAASPRSPMVANSEGLGPTAGNDGSAGAGGVRATDENGNALQISTPIVWGLPTLLDAEKEMFTIFCGPLLQVLEACLPLTKDPALLRKILRGYREICLLAHHWKLTDILEQAISALAAQASADLALLDSSLDGLEGSRAVDDDQLSLYDYALNVCESWRHKHGVHDSSTGKSSRRASLVTTASTTPSTNSHHAPHHAPPHTPSHKQLRLPGTTNTTTPATATAASHDLGSTRTPGAMDGRRVYGNGVGSSNGGGVGSDSAWKEDAPEVEESLSLVQSVGLHVSTATRIEGFDSPTAEEPKVLFFSPAAFALRRLLLTLRSLFTVTLSCAGALDKAWEPVLRVLLELGLKECLPAELFPTAGVMSELRTSSTHRLPSVTGNYSLQTASLTSSSTAHVNASASKKPTSSSTSVAASKSNTSNSSAMAHQSLPYRGDGIASALSNEGLLHLQVSTASHAAPQTNAHATAPQKLTVLPLPKGDLCPPPAPLLAFLPDLTRGSRYLVALQRAEGAGALAELLRQGSTGSGAHAGAATATHTGAADSGGVWGVFSSFLWGGRSDSDAADAIDPELQTLVRTALAIEVAKDGRMDALLTRSASLPVPALQALLRALLRSVHAEHVLRILRDLAPAAAPGASGVHAKGGSGGVSGAGRLAAKPSGTHTPLGGGSSGGSSSGSGGAAGGFGGALPQTVGPHATPLLRLTIAQQLLTDICLRNVHRPHATLPILSYWSYEVLGPVFQEVPVTSPYALYLAERLTFCLTRLTARALSTDALPTGQATTTGITTSTTTTADSGSTAKGEPKPATDKSSTKADQTKFFPISAALSYLQLLHHTLPPGYFEQPTIASRIAVGVLSVLRSPLCSSHFQPYETEPPAANAATASPTPPSVLEMLSSLTSRELLALQTFHHLCISFLILAGTNYIASHSVWEGICLLLSGGALEGLGDVLKEALVTEVNSVHTRVQMEAERGTLSADQLYHQLEREYSRIRSLFANALHTCIAVHANLTTETLSNLVLPALSPRLALPPLLGIASATLLPLQHSTTGTSSITSSVTSSSVAVRAPGSTPPRRNEQATGVVSSYGTTAAALGNKEPSALSAAVFDAYGSVNPEQYVRHEEQLRAEAERRQSPLGLVTALVDGIAGERIGSMGLLTAMATLRLLEIPGSLSSLESVLSSLPEEYFLPQKHFTALVHRKQHTASADTPPLSLSPLPPLLSRLRIGRAVTAATLAMRATYIHALSLAAREILGESAIDLRPSVHLPGLTYPQSHPWFYTQKEVVQGSPARGAVLLCNATAPGNWAGQDGDTPTVSRLLIHEWTQQVAPSLVPALFSTMHRLLSHTPVLSSEGIGDDPSASPIVEWRKLFTHPPLPTPTMEMFWSVVLDHSLLPLLQAVFHWGHQSPRSATGYSGSTAQTSKETSSSTAAGAPFSPGHSFTLALHTPREGSLSASEQFSAALRRAVDLDMLQSQNDSSKRKGASRGGGLGPDLGPGSLLWAESLATLTSLLGKALALAVDRTTDPAWILPSLPLPTVGRTDMNNVRPYVPLAQAAVSLISHVLTILLVLRKVKASPQHRDVADSPVAAYLKSLLVLDASNLQDSLIIAQQCLTDTVRTCVLLLTHPPAPSSNQNGPLHLNVTMAPLHHLGALTALIPEYLRGSKDPVVLAEYASSGMHRLWDNVWQGLSEACDKELYRELLVIAGGDVPPEADGNGAVGGSAAGGVSGSGSSTGAAANGSALPHPEQQVPPVSALAELLAVRLAQAMEDLAGKDDLWVQQTHSPAATATATTATATATATTATTAMVIPPSSEEISEEKKELDQGIKPVSEAQHRDTTGSEDQDMQTLLAVLESAYPESGTPHFPASDAASPEATTPTPAVEGAAAETYSAEILAETSTERMVLVEPAADTAIETAPESPVSASHHEDDGAGTVVEIPDGITDTQLSSYLEIQTPMVVASVMEMYPVDAAPLPIADIAPVSSMPDTAVPVVPETSGTVLAEAPVASSPTLLSEPTDAHNLRPIAALTSQPTLNSAASIFHASVPTEPTTTTVTAEALFSHPPMDHPVPSPPPLAGHEADNSGGADGETAVVHAVEVAVEPSDIGSAVQVSDFFRTKPVEVSADGNGSEIDAEASHISVQTLEEISNEREISLGNATEHLSAVPTDAINTEVEVSAHREGANTIGQETIASLAQVENIPVTASVPDTSLQKEMDKEFLSNLPHPRHALLNPAKYEESVAKVNTQEITAPMQQTMGQPQISQPHMPVPAQPQSQQSTAPEKKGFFNSLFMAFVGHDENEIEEDEAVE